MWRRKSFWMPTFRAWFDQVGISPLKADELLHDGGEKDTHTVWATFTDVAEAAKDSAHGGGRGCESCGNRNPPLCVLGVA